METIARILLFACCAATIVPVGCTSAASMTLSSPAFKEGDPIPVQYTGDGADRSPPLEWTGVPEGTKAFALICEDPDAPVGLWIHWVVYNLPPETRQLAEGMPSTKEFPDGTRLGTTSFGRVGYGGPKPPNGTHRYFFRLYALDAALGLPSGATRQQLLDAMRGHVLQEAVLMGRYSRARNM